MKENKQKMTDADRPDGRIPYRKPEIKRVDLALEETLSAGCKLADSVCTDPFPGVSNPGS